MTLIKRKRKAPPPADTLTFTPALPGDATYLEGKRYVVAAPCSSEAVTRFCCIQCRCLLANIFQVEEHIAAGGVHWIAGWCDVHGPEQLHAIRREVLS